MALKTLMQLLHFLYNRAASYFMAGNGAQDPPFLPCLDSGGLDMGGREDVEVIHSAGDV